MWYVIQTRTGQEEEILLFFDRMISGKLYKKCFVPKGEWLKRLGGRWQLKINPLFPGYVFVETDKPDELFLELKAIPKLTKLLSDGAYDFTPLRPDEEAFLRKIMGEKGDYIVRMSTVCMEEDGAASVTEGILTQFKDDIVRINMRKRFALVRVWMLGQERTVIFGIKLLKDQEIINI